MRKSTKKAKKKTSKKSGNDWNKHVMQVFKDLRAKDPNARLGDAMKAAKNKPQYPYVAHVSIYAKVMFLVNKISGFILL